MLYSLGKTFPLFAEARSAIPAHRDEIHRKDSKAEKSQMTPSYSLSKEDSKLAPMMATPRKHNTFPARMKIVVRRIWAGTKKGHETTTRAQMTEETDNPPPQYDEIAAEVVEEASIQKSTKPMDSKSNGGAISKSHRNAVRKVSRNVWDSSRNAFSKTHKNAVLKSTGSNDQKPVDSNARKSENSTVGESTPGSQQNPDHSVFSCARLTQVIENKVDTVKLLRSVLVFIMFIAFHGDLDKIKTDTGSLFPWSATIFTRTDANPSNFFSWDVFEITRDLSMLVRYLEHTVSCNRWFNVRQEHKDLLIQLVIKPAEDLKIQTDYALEVLGTFRQNQLKDGSIDYYSLIDYWKPRAQENLPGESPRMLDFGDTVASHASFIVSLNLQEKQQSELEDAIAKYLKKRNLKELQMSNILKREVLKELKSRPHGTCCWPMTDGYMDLFQWCGKTDNSHWRDCLKQEREWREQERRRKLVDQIWSTTKW
jgi:hypothetical protein